MTQLELQVAMDSIVEQLLMDKKKLEWIEETLHSENDRIVEEIEGGYWDE